MIAREASNCVEQLLIDEASKAAIDRVIGNAQTTILVMKDAAQQLRDNQHLQQLEMLKAKR